MKQLYSAAIKTTIGALTGVADDQFLYILQFSDSILLKKHLSRLQSKLGTGPIKTDFSDPLVHMTQELELYFSGKLTAFQTPIFFNGSDFQNKVWNELLTIPCGSVVSYSNVAKCIEHEKAHRATATAIAQNPLLIIIPCHRVIQKSGKLGDYAGGRGYEKQKLLEIEQYISQKNHTILKQSLEKINV